MFAPSFLKGYQNTLVFCRLPYVLHMMFTVPVLGGRAFVLEKIRETMGRPWVAWRHFGGQNLKSSEKAHLL